MEPAPQVDEKTAPAGPDAAVRFAAYLISGVLALITGLSLLATGLVEILECVQKTFECLTGPSVAFFDSALPPLVIGSVLVVVAIVLLVAAYRRR